MLEKRKHKINRKILIFCLKISLVFFVFLSSSDILKSQSTDEVFKSEIKTYRVQNQGYNSWLYWEISGGEILSENPTQTDSIVIKWNDVGRQQLSVYEKSMYDCIGETYTIQVEVIENNEDLELEIYNAFTPNNDGINDFFVVRANQKLDNYKLIIINRWGNKLYESHSLSDKWDGKYNGKRCSTSTYFYIINYSYKGQKKVKKGFVYLF